jgi:hypothetical protein
VSTSANVVCPRFAVNRLDGTEEALMAVAETALGCAMVDKAAERVRGFVQIFACVGRETVSLFLGFWFHLSHSAVNILREYTASLNCSGTDLSL